jgi:hypothetical protein
LGEGIDVLSLFSSFITVIYHHRHYELLTKGGSKMPEETEVKKEPIDAEMTAQQLHDFQKQKEEYFNTHDAGVLVFLGKGEEDGRSKG